jgi:TRAP-type mannitol/chloroaromatic compound transport system permease small subunit
MIPWCPLLVLGLVGYALIDFIVIFAYNVVDRVYTESASGTFIILGLFFQAFMYLSVPLLASSKALEIEGAERLNTVYNQKPLYKGPINSL